MLRLGPSLQPFCSIPSAKLVSVKLLAGSHFSSIDQEKFQIPNTTATIVVCGVCAEQVKMMESASSSQSHTSAASRRLGCVLHQLQPSPPHEIMPSLCVSYTSGDQQQLGTGAHDDAATNPSSVAIGNVSLKIRPSSHPELIPFSVAPMGSPISHPLQAQEVLGEHIVNRITPPPKKFVFRLSCDALDESVHLRWMMQKDKLGQDMFLIGYISPPPPHQT